MLSFFRGIFNFLTTVVVYVLLAALLLFLIEGICSGLLVGLDLYRLIRETGIKNHYQQYDPDLGWISRPNIDIKDMFAPGVYLKTNGQSFRNDQDFSSGIPAGKSRILCAGDSFTFGDGVSNDQTWCEALTVLDPNLEAVNMGQPGYGIDQAYLWYKREGLKVRHEAVIFAFVADDFRRIGAEYPDKPYLVWNGEALEVRNTPVPYSAYLSSQFSSPLSILSRFRTMEIIRALCDRFLPKKNTEDPSSNYLHSIQTAFKVFEDVDRLAKERGAAALFVYLPVYEEYALDMGAPLRRTLAAEFKERKLSYLDLTGSLKKYTSSEIRKFYLTRKDVPFAGDPDAAAKHYSFAGNQFVADNVYRYLTDGTQTVAAAIKHRQPENIQNPAA